MKIVDRRYEPASLIEPTTLWNVHMAARIHPRMPLLQLAKKKRTLLDRLSALTATLERFDAVKRGGRDGVALENIAKLVRPRRTTRR